MRIACLQFAPQVGDVDNNLNRADAVLSKANPQDLDLLVLPELAFSGYNFRSLQHITPYLEPTTAGITSLWARTTALKYNCVVTVGYPEKVDVTPKWPASLEYYNSAITVNSEGETIANYRKSFLYYTDETWALEGPSGFYDGVIEGLGNVAMGICMDLNPYKFEAPWSAWEFSYHILHRQANLVILSMAWLTTEDPRSYSRLPKEPDMDTLSYWMARLEPVIRAESVGEIIVVLANRTGTEEEAVYAGTSTVLGIEDGEVRVYGILGRGEKELLVVDTSKRPKAKLISEPNSGVSELTSPRNEQAAPLSGHPARHSPSSTSIQIASSLNMQTTNVTSPILDQLRTDTETPLSGYDCISPENNFVMPRHSTPALESQDDIKRHFSPVDARKTRYDPIDRPESPKSRHASRDASRTRVGTPSQRSRSLSPFPKTSTRTDPVMIRPPSRSSPDASMQDGMSLRASTLVSGIVQASLNLTESSPRTSRNCSFSSLNGPTQNRSPPTMTGQSPLPQISTVHHSPRFDKGQQHTTPQAEPPFGWKSHTRCNSRDSIRTRNRLQFPPRISSRSTSPSTQASSSKPSPPLPWSFPRPPTPGLPPKPRSSSLAHNLPPIPSLLGNDFIGDGTVILAPVGMESVEVPLWPSANPANGRIAPNLFLPGEEKALPDLPDSRRLSV